MAFPLWVLAGVVTAVSQSVKAFLQKKLVEDSGLELSFITSLYTAILLLPVAGFYFIQGVDVSLAVWGAISFVGISNGIALLMFFTSLETEDLSIASPLQQTIPLFVALMEPLILATGYSLNILSGAFLTVLGSYFVMFDGKDYTRPLKKIGSKGPLLALGSAFFFGLGAIAVKYVVSNVEVGLFLSLVFWFSAATTGLGVYFRSNIEMEEYRDMNFVYLGIATAASQALIFYTIDLSSASEATILFRLSIIFNVLIGFKLFNEEDLVYRMLGTLLVIAGIAFII